MSLPFRDFARRLEPYRPGEQPTDPRAVKLNTNENPYPPAPAVMAALAGLGGDALRKYPPATSDPLRDVIAERLGLGLRRENIVVGYGSDEVLRLLCHAATAPDRPLASLNPSYSLYPCLGDLYEARTVFFDETPPAGPGDAARLPDAFVDAEAPLVFLPNPNPPYGTLYPLSEIERLCEARPDRLVVADEAYIDFAPPDASALSLLGRFENLVVTRSFSKSYSLAGMRVGFGVASGDIVHVLMSLKDSYNLPIASQVAALAAWEAVDHFEESRRRVIAGRERLTAGLRELGWRVMESAGNFVFARRPDAGHVFEALKERGVYVRHWDKPRLDDGLRISVGTDEEIDRLFEALVAFDAM